MRFDEMRYWGVEIEIAGDREPNSFEVANAIEARGIIIRVEGYNHQTREHWKVVRDGSCGLEVVSPPLQGAEGFRQLREVCLGLQDAGAKVDRKCGIHVHHDLGGLDDGVVKRTMLLYHRFEETIDSLLAPSRRGSVNTYCGSLRDYGTMTLEDMAARFQQAERQGFMGRLDSISPFSNRYRKVNLNGYRIRGTIEFRQHQGSLNASKIQSWIVFTQALLNRAQDHTVQARTTGATSWGNLKHVLRPHEDEYCADAIKVLNRQRRKFAAA